MKLRNYLFNEKMPASVFARKIGVSGNHMRLIVREEQRPGLELAQRIEIETGGQVTVGELRQAGRRKIETQET